MMSRFRQFIDGAELQELYLKGRLYTWSNERDRPTLERLDRVFTSEDWVLAFPNHELSALATECSDHAPLLLKTDCSIPHCARFRFEDFWPKCEGYLQVVEEAWNTPLPWSNPDVDAFPCLDFKLQNTAKALKSWSAKRVGSVRLQLAIAKRKLFSGWTRPKILGCWHPTDCHYEGKQNCAPWDLPLYKEP